MFVPLLVASHSAVTKNINEVKKFKLAVNFVIALGKIFTKLNIIVINKKNLCGDYIFTKIEHKQNNCLKIEKTWRIAPMRVAFKKDDL